jgi:tetratricopeptide (TPR) repeat protein
MDSLPWNEVLGWSKEDLQDLRFLGFSYLKQGRYEVAISFFEALTILAPHSAYDLQTLAALHLECGNNLMALNMIERALKLDSNHFATLLNRVKVLFSLGYKRQALAQAKQLAEISDSEIADQASALLLAYT